MKKLLSTLFLAAFAMTGAHAASHAGGAPMKASEPAAKASEPVKKKAADKKEKKKEETKKEAKTY